VADDDRLRVCLERTVELEGPRLRVRDWPGHRGPVVHVQDPAGPPASSFVEAFAASVAPRYRVLSLQPRDSGTYQVDAADLLAMLDTFGFRAPVLLGERLGCVPALLVAAWHPDRMAGLVLVDPLYAAPLADDVRSRALLDCPPDWPRLRARILCPVLETGSGASVGEEIRRFLDDVCG
jgi:pimeloyl-ACP methyl ester carboxylesterase